LNKCSAFQASGQATTLLEQLDLTDKGTTVLQRDGSCSPITQHHIPEGFNLKQYCFPNLKSYTAMVPLQLTISKLCPPQHSKQNTMFQKMDQDTVVEIDP
jgi:hypothetical protein